MIGCGRLLKRIMWIKRDEEGYCLFHNTKIDRKKAHNKCTNPRRQGCNNGKRRKYFLILKKEVSTK